MTNQSSVRWRGMAEALYGLPLLLGALTAVIFAVDALLAWQPALIEHWSVRLHDVLDMHAVERPAEQMLAAGLAVGAVVLASLAASWLVRAVSAAPQLSAAATWVALCVLLAARQRAPILPLPAAVFLGLSALLLVVGAVVVSAGSGKLTRVWGWALIAAPCSACLLLLGPSAFMPHSAADAFGAMLALATLGAGLAGLSRTQSPHQPRGRQIEGLDGVDLLDELFTQVERAERAEVGMAALHAELRALRAGCTCGRSAERSGAR